jgi:hypothetical protein
VRRILRRKRKCHGAPVRRLFLPARGIFLPQIENKTAPPWQLETTDKDLQMSIALIKDDAVRAGFEALVERLRAM